MGMGIKVIWPYEDIKVDEIEYFVGVDVNNLDELPTFTSVRADWPRYPDEPTVEYNIDARYERKSEREVHLIVDYDVASNCELATRYPDMYWGTNTIILKAGKQKGRCKWLRRNESSPETVHWEAFDLERNHGRPRATYQGSRRQAQFRRSILACDDHRCVITGETTPEALEAAHLVPARNGENDMPFNGIALRADLHRLFDADRFTFAENGDVVVVGPCLSGPYRRLLCSQTLPPATLKRVGTTLALEKFRNR